jgi:hypothetical protein
VLLVLILVTLGSLGWEFFEFSWDLFMTPIYGTPAAQPSQLDTMIDVIVGFLGAVIGVLVYPKMSAREE